MIINPISNHSLNLYNYMSQLVIVCAIQGDKFMIDIIQVILFKCKDTAQFMCAYKLIYCKV